MSRTLRFALLPVALLSCTAMGEQAAAPAGAATAQAEELDEVAVVSKKLWQLRQQMVVVEDRFYALYNKLNTDDEFDVHCTVRPGVGRDTHLNTRICEVQYILEAQAAAAQGWLDAMFFNTGNEDGTGGGAGSWGRMPASSLALGRAEEYRRTMLAVINRSPELLRLVRERERLGQRYEEVRRERAGWRWFQSQ